MRGSEEDMPTGGPQVMLTPQRKLDLHKTIKCFVGPLVTICIIFICFQPTGLWFSTLNVPRVCP